MFNHQHPIPLCVLLWRVFTTCQIKRYLLKHVTFKDYNINLRFVFNKLWSMFIFYVDSLVTQILSLSLSLSLSLNSGTRDIIILTYNIKMNKCTACQTIQTFDSFHLPCLAFWRQSIVPNGRIFLYQKTSYGK